MHQIHPSDFWQWAFSDFLSNSLRGVLAEYIVAKALNCDQGKRIEWDAYDLKMSNGIRIEVKASGYIQTWSQKKQSDIKFDIAKKRSWFSETNKTNTIPARPADYYVFCIFQETNKALANPLDVDQWFFLVANAEFLDTRFGNQKTVCLSSLEKCGIKRCKFEEIAQKIENSTPNPALNSDAAATG